VPCPDVILVARVGYTPLSWLADAVDGLGHIGTRVRGIVLWDADVPQVPTREELTAALRGRRTAVLGGGTGRVAAAV
jgi:Mrp family chromosome partitioning ATPase